MAGRSDLNWRWKRYIRRAVLLRDGGVCRYCGRQATEVDHVIPVAKGGAATLDNSVAACRRCNASKGARLDWQPPERTSEHW